MCQILMSGDRSVFDGPVLQLSEFTLGRPYHAALCRVGPRHPATSFHTHQDFYELFYVLSGQGQHRLSVGAQALSAGDLVLVRPTDWHNLAGLPPTGLEWINVAVPAATWRGLLDMAGVVSADDLNRDRQPTLVSVSGADARRLESSFREALARYHLVADRIDLMRFIVEVLDLLRAKPGDGSLLPDWLARACTAMGNEENLKGGVRRLGELAGVSAGHLCRTIRAHYGLTPTSFVADLRLRHAEMLLATTSASLTEISYRCGFSNPSYFSKSFRSSRGESPRDFRYRAREAVLPRGRTEIIGSSPP
jgi:AraC-like DNA-binding protein/mannose-6-phosphate isomerase-like protein (cupin superfamily)